MAIEDDVREVLAGLDQQQDPNPQDETELPQEQPEEKAKRIIHVNQYTLEDGSALFRFPDGKAIIVPPATDNPLDENAIDSIAPTIQGKLTETPTIEDVQGEEEELPQEPEPEGVTGRFTSPFFLVPLALLCILAAGTVSYVYLLPLMATATVTITPQVKSLHTDTTFIIATNPKEGQVKGREFENIRLTKSITVPATGHAHDDATAAAGIITFYNADATAYTIPAGTSFTVEGVTVVTDNDVTVQAAVPPSFGIGITQAHTIQAGSVGNIAAHTIDTRCCGSQFVTATNTSGFFGGQDARSYSFIQSSDIQNAASDLLASLTPKTTAALNKEARPGEQLVTPLCNPKTQESAEPGTAATDVTVSVTQTCYSVAYLTDSLNQVATSTLAQSRDLANYQQEGAVQVTVNGSTYQKHTAMLKVSLSGVWIYHFTQAQITQLTQRIAGESQEQAKAILEREAGITSVSIHVQRLDFKDQLPTNPQHISVQFFYIVS